MLEGDHGLGGLGHGALVDAAFRVSVLVVIPQVEQLAGLGVDRAGQRAGVVGELEAERVGEVRLVALADRALVGARGLVAHGERDLGEVVGQVQGLLGELGRLAQVREGLVDGELGAAGDAGQHLLGVDLHEVAVVDHEGDARLLLLRAGGRVAVGGEVERVLLVGRARPVVVADQRRRLQAQQPAVAGEEGLGHGVGPDGEGLGLRPAQGQVVVAVSVLGRERVAAARHPGDARTLEVHRLAAAAVEGDLPALAFPGEELLHAGVLGDEGRVLGLGGGHRHREPLGALAGRDLRCDGGRGALCHGGLGGIGQPIRDLRRAGRGEEEREDLDQLGEPGLHSDSDRRKGVRALRERRYRRMGLRQVRQERPPGGRWYGAVGLVVSEISWLCAGANETYMSHHLPDRRGASLSRRSDQGLMAHVWVSV